MTAEYCSAGLDLTGQTAARELSFDKLVDTAAEELAGEQPPGDSDKSAGAPDIVVAAVAGTDTVADSKQAAATAGMELSDTAGESEEPK